MLLTFILVCDYRYIWIVTCLGLMLVRWAPDVPFDVLNIFKRLFIQMLENHIQCDSVIARSIFSQILTIDTPYLAREDDLWGVCCDSNILLTFCHCYCGVVSNIVIN